MNTRAKLLEKQKRELYMSNEINIKPSKIVTIETEIKNGIKIERGYNKANVLIKESVFILNCLKFLTRQNVTGLKRNY